MTHPYTYALAINLAALVFIALFRLLADMVYAALQAEMPTSFQKFLILSTFSLVCWIGLISIAIIIRA